MATQTILSENQAYWAGRASGYSMVNRAELSSRQRYVWRNALDKRIRAHFPRNPEELRILETGTGPGFFAAILAESGYCVTAVDLTPRMLDEAKKNAGQLTEKIRFLEMDAENLSFPDRYFDAVVSRNLTWNLLHPQNAYREWGRVLKEDGLLLNFDANWYGYLFDRNALNAYRTDRRNVAERGFQDQNIGENFDVMENIARRMPLSRIRRPDWDKKTLLSLGFQVSVEEGVWEEVWTEEEKVSFASTPLFLIRAVKG